MIFIVLQIVVKVFEAEEASLKCYNRKGGSNLKTHNNYDDKHLYTWYYSKYFLYINS